MNKMPFHLCGDYRNSKGVCRICGVQDCHSHQEIRKTPKIVFTNGCFDILHIGHVHLLKEASKLGDLLIVGMNSDDSVRRVKGKKRPIVPQEERKIMLEAIRYVDQVIIFNELTPLRLISRIKPHILVKGEDWEKIDIIGKDLVDEVIRIPVIENISSSKILERMLK